MNIVHLIGRLGKTPEIRTTSGGTTVASFSVATSERRKSESGEVKEITTWHNVIAFGRTGEVIAQYLDKGDPIAITGKINNRSYEKDGEKKYISEVVVNSFEFIGGSKSNDRAEAKQTQPAAVPDKAPAGDFWNDGVPF